MIGAKYHLTTELRLSADPEEVWEALVQVPSWPSWWRWLKRVRVLAPGDAEGLGGRFRGHLAGPMRYNIRCDIEILRPVRPTLIAFHSTGDLQGRGEIRLRQNEAGGTDFTFTWLVRTSKWWMNLLAPVARKRFIRNHDRLMADFGTGLAYGTGSELQMVTHGSLARGDEGFFEMPTGED